MGTRAGSRLRQWLLAAVIAVGLIAMHHVVAGPAGMGAMEHQASAGSPMSPVSAPVLPADLAVTMQSASDPGCPDCGAMMGHMCLAVLVAVGTLILASALSLVVPSAPDHSRPVSRGWGALPARPPPASAVRLAQLGVLRN